MRMIYFIVTSSVLVLLMLLVRSIFRKKLSPTVIYALWLIPYLRFMVPLGLVELPLFGPMFDFLNHPFSVTEYVENEDTLKDIDKFPIYNEALVQENFNNLGQGTQVFEPVYEYEQSNTEVQEIDTEFQKKELRKISLTVAGIIVWMTGIVPLGTYIVVQNRKLKRKVCGLTILEQRNGIDICLSDEIKTPCLVGVVAPKIVVTEEVIGNKEVYEYALQHELTHYKQKDHLWNVFRIAMCVIYWWNPLIWIAAKCAAEDAELSCDAIVLKDCSMEERKKYGFALLQLIAYAQGEKQNLRFATSISGSKNNMKLRIQEISKKTSTRKVILLPVLLAFVVSLAVGCVYPSNNSWIKTEEWETSESEDAIYHGAGYKYSLQEEFQSMLLYYETYEYGELTERKIFSYGNIEKYNDVLKLGNKSPIYETADTYFIEMNGVETSIEAPISNYDVSGGYASNSLYSEKGLIEVNPGDDLILFAEYQSKDQETVQSFSCEKLSFYDAEKLQDTIKEQYFVSFVRMVLSDLPSEALYKQMSQQEFPTEENANRQGIADLWAQAFIDRNASSLVKLATENVVAQLIDEQFLDEEQISFGWSSPWPVFPEEHYRIIQCDNSSAKILYYALDSTPHVYVWEEELKFEKVQEEVKVSSWSLKQYHQITSVDDFHNAYPKNQITNTPMDYWTNGLGESLNNNALLSSSEAYRTLFDPGTAALDLLNISREFDQVQYKTEENNEEVIVHLTFLNGNGTYSGIDVTMWQPYGDEGIWIPKTNDSEENTLMFYKEPENDKVCLAVMPDGISKAGGDYRYIIPEDQVKWMEQYKQARSLAKEGGWKDDESSTGIWLVFQDEWTCITEKGMIFDFDQRVEKRQIEEFYHLCVSEAWKYGTGSPINPAYFPKIVSATLEYNGKYTVTDESTLNDLRKMIFTSKEIRGGAACPFTAALTLELETERTETLYLATDSCGVWMSDGVYFEYFAYENIDEFSEIFKRNSEKSAASKPLGGNSSNADFLIKNAEGNVRDGYEQATLTYVDNTEVGWNFYNENPWESNAERDALAQAALKELYTLTGYQVDECTYTTDGRSRFIFGKNAEYIKKSIAFYSRDYGFELCGDSTPYMGYVNARRAHYSDIQQLDSPYKKKEYTGQAAIPMWFLEHSGVYRGETIIGFEAINLDDTVYTHIKLNFDGGYYLVVMDEKIESVHEISGPYQENSL